MCTLRFRTDTLKRTSLVGLLFGATLLAANGFALAQVSEEERTSRRDAILQQDQLFTDDDQIVDPDAIRIPPPQTVVAVPQARTNETQTQTAFQTVAWRGRYYGRPYAGAYYYGPPRGRYYARYPGNYNPYYDRYYGDRYYGGYGYGYGYRGNYYGTPRVGYYDGPYGGGAVRVGPMRFGWR